MPAADSHLDTLSQLLQERRRHRAQAAQVPPLLPDGEPRRLFQSAHALQAQLLEKEIQTVKAQLLARLHPLQIVVVS